MRRSLVALAASLLVFIFGAVGGFNMPHKETQEVQLMRKELAGRRLESERHKRAEDSLSKHAFETWTTGPDYIEVISCEVDAKLWDNGDRIITKTGPAPSTLEFSISKKALKNKWQHVP